MYVEVELLGVIVFLYFWKGEFPAFDDAILS